MGPLPEQISHQPVSVNDARELPGRDDIRGAEVRDLVRRVVRFRLVLLPVGALFLTLVVLFDRQVWKMWALGGVVVALGLLALYDLRSLRRMDTREPSMADPAIALGVQTALIWLTGAIESPLVVIYVPLALVLGLAAPGLRSRLAILLTASGLLWLMTLAGLFGWVPRTVPAFLDLGDGFYSRPVYALTKAGVLNVVLVVACQVGAGLQGLVNRMIDRAINSNRQAALLLGERNRELVHLSGAIAHELKNPLASVQGLVQLLARGGGHDERERSRLEVLSREVSRMRDTLDEFLNFSRPLGDLTVQEIDVGRLFDDLTALHEGIAQSRRIQIRLPAPPLPALRADPRKLGQALTNLLQNALDATPSGGRIDWIAEREGDDVLLGLEDGGPGMPAPVLERLSTGGATTKPGGSGIGLAVARAIAEQHGGHLMISNPPGGGCRSLLRLPGLPPLCRENESPT